MIYIVDTDNALFDRLACRTEADIMRRCDADCEEYMLINADNCPDLTPPGKFGIILLSGDFDSISDWYAQRADNAFSDFGALCDFLSGICLWHRRIFSEQEERARVYLKLIGMDSELSGLSYIAFLTAYLTFAPDASLKYDIMPAMEEYFGKSAQSMERTMRYAIEVTWSRGDMDAQQRLFGYSISPDRGKPVTRELASLIAERLREQMNTSCGAYEV